MEKTDILVIGAGAAGLMAAYKLSQQGKKVIVLEARNRTGGRIHTINQESFFQHAELGAEFIHGDLPVTLNLLKEAGIKYRE
jgi:monoamine oxidase